MVKLAEMEDSVTMAKRVNEAILDRACVLLNKSETTWAGEGELDVIICDGVPGVTFPAVHAVDQVGLLTDEVVALGDGINGPVVLAVSDPQYVMHDPLLRRALERNAVALINNLEEGVWLFGVVKTRAGIRLELKNPPEVDGRRFAFSAVDPKEVTVADTK